MCGGRLVPDTVPSGLKYVTSGSVCGLTLCVRLKDDKATTELASTPRAASHRASQKPSRPASKASAIRVNCAAGPERLIPRAIQQGKQPFRPRLQLLARLMLNAGKHSANLQATPFRIILWRC